MEKQQPSRREFVKQTSLLAGSLIAAPFISQATNYFSGSDNIIKVALIGCGGRGTGAAMQALLSKQNVKLVAMADAFRDRLEGCLKTIQNEDASLKDKIDVPAERKFVGFDAN